MSPKKFRKISHAELDIYLCLSDFSKELSKLAHWKTHKKLGNISCSWWDIFQKFFGDNPDVFVHYFQTITIFLYVCQSVSLLIYLLNWCKYRDISCPGGVIFLKYFWDIPWIFYISSKDLKNSCSFVGLVIGLLPHLNRARIVII